MLTIEYQGDSTQLFYDSSKLILTMEETETPEGHIVMTLKGSMRSDTANPFQDELSEFISAGVPVTIDFKEITFVAPSVLNALLNVQQLVDQLHQGKIVLRSIPDAVYQEMDETGITELLMIEE